MNDRVLLVTEPDDTLEQGVRIAVIGLLPEQSLTVSQALAELESTPCLISYIWNINESLEWIIDKLYKSDVIFFNAEIENQILVGYLAAQHNAHYFGRLRSLNQINKSEIHSVDRCLDILENAVRKHGKK
jgi:hypothetical protein